MKKIALFLGFLLFFWSPPVLLAKPDDINPEYWKVPVDDFVASVNSTLQRVQTVSSFVVKLRDAWKDVRVTDSLSYCLDMLDASSQKLGWIVTPSGVQVGTKDLVSDSRAWLSSVLANQDACIDEAFRGSKEIRIALFKAMFRSKLKKQLDQISSSVTTALYMIRSPSSIFPFDKKPTKTDDDSWLRNKKYTQITRLMANVVVALDGTGNFTRISEAVNVAPDNSVEQFVIYVKAGVYKEYLVIPRNKWNVVMVGDGMGVTTITGNRSAADGLRTLETATFAVKGPRFIGQDMIFENTAGPEKSQALAYFSDSDLSVLYRCSVLGNQNTLHAYSQRQFFKQCVIQGTVDFISGRASAVFQHCVIVARQGLHGQKNTITAQGRRSFSEISAFSFQFCSITALPEMIDSPAKTYLGRPLHRWSTTMVMESEITSVISPQGWYAKTAYDSLYFAEYSNRGSGANVSSRVPWAGYHTVTDESIANMFTVASLIDGNSWLPATGIEYVSGL